MPFILAKRIEITSATADTPWSESYKIENGYTKLYVENTNIPLTETPETCYSSDWTTAKGAGYAILNIPLSHVCKVRVMNRVEQGKKKFISI